VFYLFIHSFKLARFEYNFILKNFERRTIVLTAQLEEKQVAHVAAIAAAGSRISTNYTSLLDRIFENLFGQEVSHTTTSFISFPLQEQESTPLQLIDQRLIWHLAFAPPPFNAQVKVMTSSDYIVEYSCNVRNVLVPGRLCVSTGKVHKFHWHNI
jgi:hypothetical protein